MSDQSGLNYRPHRPTEETEAATPLSHSRTATPQTRQPARIPMPWERRLGLILGSYFCGYTSILTYEQNPDGSGVWVGLTVTAALLIASLPSTIRNKKA